MSELNTKILSENYGPIKAGKEYRCVSEGLDYVVLKTRGHRYCVPLFYIQKFALKTSRFLPTYEEIIEEED